MGDGFFAAVRKQVGLQIGKTPADADDLRLRDQVPCEGWPQEGDDEKDEEEDK